ncbi:MAG: efflux transporter outer membrane subunit [Rhodanobacteraceae bacterium]
MSRWSRHERAFSRRCRYIFGSLALLAMCSCSTVRVPDLSTPVPPHWRNQPAGIAAAQPDLHGWWHAFGDPTLDALVTRSLHANLDVAQAVERLRAQRALYAKADAPFLPSLHLRTDDPVDPDAAASYFTVGFDAQWELGLFGRREAANRNAQASLDAATANLRQAQVSLVAEVVRNWIDLRSAQNTVKVLQGIHQAQQRKLEWIQVRTRLKLAPPSDLAQARAAVARSDAEFSLPRQQVTAAAQRLAVLLGQSEPDPAWLRPGKMPQLGEHAIKATPADLLRTRPEIAQAEAHVLQAAADLGIARAEMYPNIGIGGSLIWSTSTLTHKQSEFNAIGSVGPVIDIPLFDWGLRQARAHARSHELKASVLAYRKAVLEGVAEVETALGNLAQQRKREQANVASVEALGSVAKQQTERQKLGLDSKLESEKSVLAHDQAQLELMHARAARDIAYVALYKALGGAPEAAPESSRSHGHADDKHEAAH